MPETPERTSPFRAPARVGTKLKAERIQEKLKAERIQEKLKAERIQQRLADELPGWEVAPEAGLRRVLAFPTARAAALFVPLAAEVGQAAGRPPALDVRGSEVILTIATAPEGGVTDLDFELASLYGSSSAGGEDRPEGEGGRSSTPLSAQ